MGTDKVASINNLAFRTLQFSGILHDIFYCASKIINPWAGIPSNVWGGAECSL